MPVLGAVDPANLRAQARAELGLLHELAQPQHVEPHPRGGGSSGYSVWNREEQLVHNVARRATPAVGADPVAPAPLTAPSTPTLRLSAQVGTEGAMLYSNSVSALTSIVVAFAKWGDLLIVDKGIN